MCIICDIAGPPKMVRYVNVVPTRPVWVHPKRPSKAEGRQGTKRTWKRQNPSTIVQQVSGPPVVMRIPA